MRVNKYHIFVDVVKGIFVIEENKTQDEVLKPCEFNS